MFTILFTFHQKELEPIEITDQLPGYSLLEIALQNGIALSHECGGICQCSTCHVYIDKGIAFLQEMSRRERDVLKKVSNARSSSRLACQCLITGEKGSVEVTIPPHQGF